MSVNRGLQRSPLENASKALLRNKRSEYYLKSSDVYSLGNLRQL